MKQSALVVLVLLTGMPLVAQDAPSEPVQQEQRLVAPRNTDCVSPPTKLNPTAGDNLEADDLRPRDRYIGHHQSGNAALHIVVVSVGEQDPTVLSDVRALGADTVVTCTRPSAESAAAAAAAGLRYMPFLSVNDVYALMFDSDRVQALRAIPNLTGFHYCDEDVLEGYTPADEQQQAYSILKALFPDAFVLYTTRLDLVALEPTYLDAFFRPDATDIVGTFFYPVGTTTLGTFGEDDAWRDQLRALLSPLAQRLPDGKKVLPVLQGFEQQGFPVGARFLFDQLEVYREFWPDLEDMSVFWWGDPVESTLIGLFNEPDLRSGTARLFFGLNPPAPEPRVVGPRPTD